MADNITTRHQNEAQQIHKDMKKLDAKLDHTVDRLRAEMMAMGIDLRNLFEQLMMKVGSPSNEPKIGLSGTSDSTALKMKAVATPGQENNIVTQSMTEHIDLIVGSHFKLNIPS